MGVSWGFLEGGKLLYSSLISVPTSEPISGTQVKAKNITSICNFFLLTCSVTLGNPTRFNWWKNSEPLGNDSIHYFQENRDTVEIHHSGAVAGIVYKCEASNPISKNKAEILLKDICEHPGECQWGNWVWFGDVLSKESGLFKY